MKEIEKAVETIKKAHYLSAFTGAGISIESGIPTFRGDDGIWTKYDPELFEITYFQSHPKKSWILMKKIFFDVLANKKPNDAHIGLAKLEQNNILKILITQNIDNLDYKAGSKNIVEYHGDSRFLVCENCEKKYPIHHFDLNNLPPRCLYCDAPLKPHFVFFGEGIPQDALMKSLYVEEKSDVMLVIGTSGQVQPASSIPINAKKKGCTIIEINPNVSTYTKTITDIFIQERASIAINRILQLLEIEKKAQKQV